MLIADASGALLLFFAAALPADGPEKRRQSADQPADAARLAKQAIEPFQIQFAPELRRTVDFTGVNIDGSAQTDHQPGVDPSDVRRHPKLLLRRTETDEEQIRRSRADLRRDGAVI